MNITLANLPINGKMYEIQINKELYENHIKGFYEIQQIVSSIMSLGTDTLVDLNQASDNGFAIDQANTFGAAFNVSNETIEILSVIHTQNIFQKNAVQFFAI